MIDRDEIDDKCREMDISIANVERDYVFGWLIHGLYTGTELGDIVTLKGGNALRKGYFPLGRFSHDLDFSSPSEVDSDAVLAAFNHASEIAEANSGVKFLYDLNKVDKYVQIDETKGAYKIAVYFEDFAGQTGHARIRVRVDVSEFDRLQLGPKTRNLIHQYSDAHACSAQIRVVALEEALADKMRCLLQRRHASDLFDFVHGCFLTQDVEIDRGELMRTFLAKTVFSPDPAAAKQLLLTSSWETIRGFWEKVIAPIATLFSFDEALATMREGLEQLFGGLPSHPVLAGRFVEEPMRSQILHAGSEQRLLRIIYNGTPRIVEPYELTTKRVASGQVSEYLYVYDRTGGKSGPGIKSYKPGPIQRLEVLEDGFEPRSEVQLAKGETPGVGTFAGNGRRVGRNPTVPVKAIIRCNFCGRDFRRSKQVTTKMRKHQDSYGNQCPGRRGTRVR